MSLTKYNILIQSYGLDRINFNGTYFTPGFELYKSKNGQLAWSPEKVGDVDINPIRDTTQSSITELGVAKILAKVTMFEFKTTDVFPERILEDNGDLVKRILADIRRKG